MKPCYADYTNKRKADNLKWANRYRKRQHFFKDTLPTLACFLFGAYIIYLVVQLALNVF